MVRRLGRFLYLGAFCWALGGAFFWAPKASAFAGISVSVTPDTSYVRIDDVFNVTVQIDSVGTPCSGFENTLAWRGVNLQFVSFQPEELLNEVSWSEWDGPDVYPDSTHVYIVVYPFQGFLDHPGALYSFTFRALAPGSTPVGFSLARFGSAFGGGIQPVLTQGGEVLVADPTSGLMGANGLKSSPLRVVPNPLGPSSRIELALPAGRPGSLDIFDVAGRLLRHKDLMAAPGERGAAGEAMQSLPWSEGWRADGARRGVFFLRLCCDGRTWSTTAVR